MVFAVLADVGLDSDLIGKRAELGRNGLLSWSLLPAVTPLAELGLQWAVTLRASIWPRCGVYVYKIGAR